MDEIGLAAVPKGDWFCVTCASARAKPATKGRTKTAPPAAAEKTEKTGRKKRA